MKKIPSVFQRNYDTDRLVRDEIVPGCEWVLAGEGRATRKFDGVCCMIEGGKFYRRFELKNGKIPPQGFRPAQSADTVTGDQPGWVPVGNGPEDKWFRLALQNATYEAIGGTSPVDFPGTYEAIGPHFQGNPEEFSKDTLVPHGRETLTDFPRTFAGMREWLERNAGCIEGIVFWHPDGRMAKVKAKDFGFKRKPKAVKFAPGVSEQLDHQKAARQMMERQEKAEQE